MSSKISKVLVIGSGPIVIRRSGFDSVLDLAREGEMVGMG